MPPPSVRAIQNSGGTQGKRISSSSEHQSICGDMDEMRVIDVGAGHARRTIDGYECEQVRDRAFGRDKTKLLMGLGWVIGRLLSGRWSEVVDG